MLTSLPLHPGPLGSLWAHLKLLPARALHRGTLGVCRAVTGRGGGWGGVISSPRVLGRDHWLPQEEMARTARSSGFPCVSCSPRPGLFACLRAGSPPFSLLVKEEEKQKLLQRGGELRSERQQLEERDGRLAAAVKVRRGRGGGPGSHRESVRGLAVLMVAPRGRTDSPASLSESGGRERSSDPLGAQGLSS